MCPSSTEFGVPSDVYIVVLSEYLQSVGRARDVAVLVTLLDGHQDRLHTVPPLG